MADLRTRNAITIVSITPVALERDTRTWKIASSLGRLGYRSVVVEGLASGAVDSQGWFERISMAEAESPATNASSSPRATSVVTTPTGVSARRSWRSSVPEPLRWPLRTARFLAEYRREDLLRPLAAIPQASLYYLHSPRYAPAVLRLARRYEARVVYDAHDFYPALAADESDTAYHRFWVRPFRRYVERWCVCSAAECVTTTESMADLIADAFGRRPVVLRNSQDARLEEVPVLGLRAALGLGSSDFLVVVIGQAKPGQRVQPALQALANLPSHVHLAFLGRGYERHLETIRATGVESRVHFVPPVKPHEVVPFVRSADASLLLYYPRNANYRVFLPNGFFQAVAAGLPIVYPPLPEFEAVAGPGGFGLPVDVESAHSIGVAMRRLLDDGSCRAELRGRAAESARELDWQNEEAVLEKVIEACLRDRSS